MSEGRRRDLFGVVLAGGLASRMGGEKAGASFEGHPLIDYPLAALASRIRDVAVAAKADTVLPGLPDGVARIDEPQEPRHPAAGILAALEAGSGRPVVVLSCDLPHADGRLVDALLAEPAGGSAVIAGVAAGRVQPLVARYEPAVREGLEGFDPDRSMTSLALALGASLVAVEERAARGVNDPGELDRLSRR